MADAREIQISVNESVGNVSGLLLKPRGAQSLLVLGHGAGAGMRHRFMEAFARGLAQQKVATLRYQFPYIEAGRKAPNTPKILVTTVRAAVAEGVEVGLPVFAGGKSMGGRMTSTADSEEALGVRGIVFVGFPLHAPGRPSSHRGEHLYSVGVPMLFLQGTRDKLADLEHLEPVCKELGRKATLHIVEDGDHSFHVLKRTGRTDDEILEELTAVTAQWMAKRAT